MPCFLPGDSLTVPGLILIHEEWGLTDWVISISEQIAAEGFLVIVPDLLSGNNPVYDSLLNFTNEGVIRAALLNSDNEQIMSDLDVSFKYMKDHPVTMAKLQLLDFPGAGHWYFYIWLKIPDYQLDTYFMAPLLRIRKCYRGSSPLYSGSMVNMIHT